MDPVRFRKWEFLVDPEATRQAYAATEIGWAEFCGCIHCRNYRLARGVAYPKEALDLLERLGINPVRELDVQPYRAEDATHFRYNGHFQFVGSITSGPDFWRVRPGGGLVNNPDGMEEIAPGFLLGFTPRLGRTLKPFRGHPLVQVEFVTLVPWLLDRKMPQWG